MSPLIISLLVFICCGASAAIGIVLHIRLPDGHFDTDSKDVVKSVLGIIATMAALVLSLLIASAKSTFDTQSTEIQQLSTNVVQLDQILALYGPDTHEARTLLKRAVTAARDRVWPENRDQAPGLDPAFSQGSVQAFYNLVDSLSPANDAQRRAQATALQMIGELSHVRVLMFEQLGGSISWPLLVVLVFWVSMLFLGFGLFARLHIVIAGTLVVGSLSVASAIFLMLELSQPYQGFMRLSDAPVQAALAHMNQ